MESKFNDWCKEKSKEIEKMKSEDEVKGHKYLQNRKLGEAKDFVNNEVKTWKE